MSQRSDDSRLDENLKSLLSGGTRRPSLPTEQEQRILEALRTKQAELYGSKEKTIKLKIAGKIHDGVIEAVARHKDTDKEIPCRMTRCADIPASG